VYSKPVGVAVLATGLLAGCGGARRHPVHTTTLHVRRVVHRAPPGPHLPPGTGRLRAALDRAVKQAGRFSGGAVYDLTDHAWLFGLRAAVKRPPASVEKLYTTVAVLSKLGPHATFQTRVLGVGHRARNGMWYGNLYLRGGGDPTFGDETFLRTWEHGYGPTAAELAHQLKALGIRRVSGHVIGDGALFDDKVGPPSTGFAPDLPDLGGELGALIYDHGAAMRGWSPAAFAARELAQTMVSMGMMAQATRRTGTVPPTARVLASVSSPPVLTLLRLMNVPSDDLFAEMFAKQLGARFGAGGSTAAGAGVIERVVSSYRLHPRIVDGSGLSRLDHSSPQQVVELLRELWGTARGAQVYSSLPVVGVSGTVKTIAVHTPARGRCVAKTGTLTDVTNLAGYCHSRMGQRLAFALFVDGPPNWRALQLESAMIGAIARL
jgi:D-alanyl-D-alanine carboxypeptidase/D-alanyl-D-alanine-endopeptidase (penicillin-binding protein 4)